MSLFADTSALYALLDEDDDGHERVRDAWPGILERERLLTHGYVIAETLGLVQRRAGTLPVRRFRELVLPVLAITWVDQELLDAAIDRVVRDGRRTVSLVDHMGFELMQRLGLRRAFALDHHFAEYGFELVPTP